MLSSALAHSLFGSCSFSSLLFVCDLQQLIYISNTLSFTLSSYIHSIFSVFDLYVSVTRALLSSYDLLFTSSLIAKEKRTTTQFFDNAKSNDLKSLNKINIDSDTIFKHLEFGIKINCNRILVL